MEKARVSTLVLALLLVFAAVLAGQVGTQGSILGVVTDPSGAVVPAADVSVKHQETGLERTTQTSSTGSFEVLALPIGPYTVTVTAPGFKTWTLSDATITVGQRARVSPVLEVGQISEQITVEAAGELLQTEKSSVETTVELNQIRELPLANRNPLVLVALVPGMRYIGSGGPELGTTVQGLGMRTNQTQFQLDGVNANAAMDEGGMAVPNVDAVAEFNVATNAFSAENGRSPIQVLVATKSGTNEFHGTVYEFLQNDALNARNTFASAVPKLRRNQFGASVGGPIIRNRTFFFGSFQGTLVPSDRIFNNTTIDPAMLNGDFSSLSKAIVDPATGNPFPNNQIPTDRFSSASEYFFADLLKPNTAGNLFQALEGVSHDTWEYTGRIDHNLTDSQRIYGRSVVVHDTERSLGFRPDLVRNDSKDQVSIAGNYTNTLSPTVLLTISGGYLRSENLGDSDHVGNTNFANEAGIQGFPTAGRERFIGYPNINITGYPGISEAGFGTPLRLWSDAWNFKGALNVIRDAHTLAFGYEFDDRSVFGNHGSHSPRGSFDFNGQYTGDAFADYVLGLTAGSRRNFPLAPFGQEHAPYSALYAQDFWRLTPNFTLSFGLRYEYWHEHTLKNGNGATFDPAIGKVIAATDDGQINLTAQPVAQFLAPASEGLWVAASEVGVPDGLFEANGNWAPRLGAVWRPFTQRDLVFRAGYGLYYSTYTGNRSASSIVGIPYWTWESSSFSPLSPQGWETAWPADPDTFIQPSIGESPAWDIRPPKTHEWHFTIQTAMPASSALTLSYVGTRITGQHVMEALNEVAPGNYTNLQAAKPYTEFGQINVLNNIGASNYHGLQAKWERRFSQGLSFMASYAFSKHLGNLLPNEEYELLQPFTPPGYLRGRTGYDRTHNLFVNAVYEVPFGHGRAWGKDLHSVANAILGGWQMSFINSFTSGAPLSVTVPGATLGNGWNTRAHTVGDPELTDPNTAAWFNTGAFAAPPRLAYGSSGLGIIEGPGRHILDFGLMKNFRWSEARYVQFRWEMYNAFNHVNYNNPGTTLDTSAFGRILSAQSARTMQLGLKVVF
jgi:outer membrane receptor protein involved in Fe transport